METRYDDHIWLIWLGRAWAINRIQYPHIFLWRGYHPYLEYSVIDVSAVRWDEYCDKAVRMLKL